MSSVLKRLGPFCGLLAVLSFVPLYLVAVWIDDRYVFFENYLSDLGVSSGAWAFNSALLMAGAFIALFAFYGVRPVLGRDRVSAAGMWMLAGSGILLMGIGVFTEDFGDLHTVISIAFFLLLLATMGVLALALFKNPVLGKTGPTICGLAFLVGLSILPLGTTPFAETLAVLEALVWGIMMSAVLVLRERGWKPR